MEVRSLSSADREAIANFPCARYREPWTKVVEETIQERLTSYLERGSVSAVGLWDGSKLVGVAVWKVDASEPTVCRCIFVAVAIGHHRHGYGRRLKQAVIDWARERRCLVVVSTVHRDNAGMLALNRTFDAHIEPDPDDGLRQHLLCTIVLTGQSLPPRP